ncbi:MBL fold metallo-hydrolase [Bradyrhizobium jicamae]|uniref:MBL fold metallo-hydrolase n=1 Tax=Bradyrhizobium jicamae TaxID=280332 RepID=UPI001BA9BFA0|nr:MBL fold metallo-hydrolase [Bradyrhizobium jicamae]MBR0755317.1 MBL fold metallo-hydrolase [Bradyrhizobium jicamae]
MADASTSFGPSRRHMLAGLLAMPALAATAGASTAQTSRTQWTPQQVQAALKDATGTKLVLLGTAAGPVPGRTREMTSHVMLSNGSAYVLDCGMGVTNQFARTGIPFSALKSIFITHHHADHNIEYGPLLIVAWIQGLPLDVRAFGPPPLKQMTEDFMRAYKQTVDFWAEDFHMKPLTSVNVQEISAAGPVTEDDNVRVSAILAEHPPVTPALAYRFDFKDRAIAFSGDTAPLDAIAKMAAGADILVHETMYVPAMEAFARAQVAAGRPVQFDSFMAHMKASHTPSEDVGRIAQEAGVKTLVLSHLTPAIDGIDDDTWRAPVAKYFKGEIIVGKDLMVV